jgi:hypothetical protein
MPPTTRSSSGVGRKGPAVDPRSVGSSKRAVDPRSPGSAAGSGKKLKKQGGRAGQQLTLHGKPLEDWQDKVLTGESMHEEEAQRRLAACQSKAKELQRAVATIEELEQEKSRQQLELDKRLAKLNEELAQVGGQEKLQEDLARAQEQLARAQEQNRELQTQSREVQEQVLKTLDMYEQLQVSTPTVFMRHQPYGVNPTVFMRHRINQPYGTGGSLSCT